MTIFNKIRQKETESSDSNSSNTIIRKRYTHAPLTIEYNGVTASIKENGKVILSKPVPGSENESGELEHDEIEIPASLIFKLAELLAVTRRVKYVKASEVKDSLKENE